jgi:flagellar biosynthesis/type III secretory pathway ATPase
MSIAGKLAERAHFPAIDILASISRVADQISDQNHLRARRHISRLMSAYKEAEELIQIGAYARGSNPEVDAAIALKPTLEGFLRQGSHDRCELPFSLRALVELSLSAESAGKRGSPVPGSGARPQSASPISR